MRHLLSAAVIVLLCAGAGAARSQPVIAHPAAPPQAILALRGEQGDKAQLQLVFDKTQDGQTAAPVTVWIGTDYFTLVDGGRLTITDLRLRRRFIVDSDAHTLVNQSLYGDVMLRRVELTRRMEIAAALAKDAAKNKTAAPVPQSLDRFWIESELGILGPSPPAEPAVQQVQDGNTVLFRHDGQNAATYTPSATAIPGDLGRGWAAFIRHSLPVHPEIALALAQTGFVPTQLDFISEEHGTSERVALHLRSATLGSAEFALPPGLSPQLLPASENDPDVALMRKLLPGMIDALTVRGLDRAKQIAAARGAIDSDFKHGHKFAAALQLAEMALRWGRGATECDDDNQDNSAACFNKADIDKKLKGDPRAVAMFRAVAVQNRRPEQALAIWRNLDRSDVSNGYVVDIFLARLLAEHGDREEASRAFIAAFAGDPYIPMLYRELGDYFARASRLDLAWLSYDLGRSLPNREPPDGLSGIDTIEEGLVKAYPDMF